jgi:hypothetical protein
MVVVVCFPQLRRSCSARKSDDEQKRSRTDTDVGPILGSYAREEAGDAVLRVVWRVGVVPPRSVPRLPRGGLGVATLIGARRRLFS